ncbi:Structural maintenance of chromosomes protein 2, partial [Ascosphaera atra]
MEKLKNEIAYLEEDLKRVKHTREKELRKGGRYQALEDQVKEYSHESARLETQLDLKKSSLAEEEQRRKNIEAQAQEIKSSLQEKKTLYDQLQQRYDAAKAQLDAQTAEVEQKEELLHSLQTGVASREGQETGYQGQLQDARNRLNAATTEQEQAKMKISHLEKRVKEEEPRAAKAKEENARLLKELEGLKRQAQKLEAELAKHGFQPEREEQMHKEESRLLKEIQELRIRADETKRKVANIDFTYADPYPNFDRSKVKGLVAQLFTLDKDKMLAGTALEICAGGRLYNVVVDTAETGTALLQKGKLRKRVTIIPLNKIASFRASAEKIGAAKSIAPNKVELALSLIGYDEEVAAAMEYVFGVTLVCQDADAAKRVTFDPS